jgi:hypothetical protein
MSAQPIAVADDEQLAFCEPPIWFSVDHWDAEADELFKYGDALAKKKQQLADKEGTRQWDIGDWLLRGDVGATKCNIKGFKSKAFKKRAMEKSKARNWGSLKNLMSVAAGLPESLRHDGREGRPYLPYSLQIEVAKFRGDEDTQRRLLEMAHEGHGHRIPSVRDFRKTIAHMQKQKMLPIPAGQKQKKAVPEGHILLKIMVPNTVLADLKRWSVYKFKATRPASMLSFCAAEYIKQHRSDLDAIAAEAEAAWQEERRKRDQVAADRKRTSSPARNS